MIATSPRHATMALWLVLLVATSHVAAQPKPLENVRVAVQDAAVEADGQKRNLKIGDFLSVKESQGDRIAFTNMDRNWTSSIEASATVKAADGIDFFTKRIEANPQDAISLAVRGRLHDAFGDKLNAKKDLDNAVQLGSAEGRLYRGLYLIKQQQVDDALADFASLIESEKLLPRALIFRAQALFCPSEAKKRRINPEEGGGGSRPGLSIRRRQSRGLLGSGKHSSHFQGLRQRDCRLLGGHQAGRGTGVHKSGCHADGGTTL